MRIGVTFPQLEIGADRGSLRAYIEATRDLGYDYLLAYDHALGADPAGRPGWAGYTHESSFHEPFVLFGYAAALAPNLEVVPGVIILPQRQTALVAKQAAEVDILSGGRLRLGVGIGWNPVEFEALGMSFGDRARRIEAQIALLRRLWTEPVITFHGTDHTVNQAGLNPLPIQQPIPIWIGGGAERVLERIGRIGDGWFPMGRCDDAMLEKLARLKGYTEAADRPASAVGIDARIDMSRIPETEWSDEIVRWRAAGATHLSINTMGQHYSVEQHIDAIARFRSLV